MGRVNGATSGSSNSADPPPLEELPRELYWQKPLVGRSIQSVRRGIVEPYGTTLEFPASDKTATGTAGIGVGFAKSSRGVFINSIRSRSMAAESEDVVLGMLVEEVNGAPVQGLSTGKLEGICNSGDAVTIKVRYDPQLYATIDGGRELRRIQSIVFQGDSPVLDRNIEVVRSLGSMTVASASEMSVLRTCDLAASDKNRFQSVTKSYVPLSVSNHAVVIELNVGDTELPPLALPLFDIMAISGKGTYMGLVLATKTFEHGLASTELNCHIFQCKTKALTTELIGRIQTRREHGEIRIRQAVRKSMAAAQRSKTILQLASAGLPSGSVHEAKSDEEVTATVLSSPSLPVSPPALTDKKSSVRRRSSVLSDDDEVGETTDKDSRPITEADLGVQCTVRGYDTKGVIRYVGSDQNGRTRVGVELDDPLGKNDGEVKGYRYFTCDKKKGILVNPRKVKVISKDRLDSSAAFEGFVPEQSEPVPMRKNTKRSSMKKNKTDKRPKSEVFGFDEGTEELTPNAEEATPKITKSKSKKVKKKIEVDDDEDEFGDGFADAEESDDDNEGFERPASGSPSSPPKGAKAPPDALDAVHTYTCVYHGSTVHSDMTTELANVAAFCYFDVVEDPANEKVNARISISRQAVVITERKGEEVLQRHSVQELLYHEDLGEDFFVYITCPRFGTLRRQGRVKFCHVISLKSKAHKDNVATFNAFAAWASGENELEEARTKALVSTNARLLARKRSVNTIETLAAVEEKVSEEMVEAIRARMLGRVVLPPGSAGKELADQSVQSLAQKKKIRPINVAIVVEEDGVRIVDELSQDCLLSILTTQITFAVGITDNSIIKYLKGKFKNWNEALYVIMHMDTQGRCTADIYSTAGRTAPLSQALAKSFASSAKKRTMSNDPFAPISKNRTEITGPIGKIQIPRDKLVPLKPIGQGEFGFVYLAHHYMPVPGGGEARSARACKLLKPNAQLEDRTLFLKEIEVMMAFDHENVIKLVGVCVSQRPWIAVIEFMQYNDVRKFLRFAKDKNVSFSKLELLHIAHQAAAGMRHVAEKQYIHMDLAARNLLLAENSVVKVADFGSAVKLPEGKKVFNLDFRQMVSVKWAAFESISKKKFSEKSDVWSYGVTVWEIFSYGATPYKGIKPTQMLAKITEDKIRLKRPKHCDEVLWKMIMSCWNDRPSQRPTFAMLYRQIREHMEQFEQSGQHVRDLGVVAREGKMVQKMVVELDDEDDV